jgi:uncharacterized protein YjbI with pentapeptide repeats
MKVKHKKTGEVIWDYDDVITFENVRLSGDKFEAADLRGANFSQSFTQSVNFTDPDLQGANFRGNSAGAVFRRASLTGVDLSFRKPVGRES